MKLNYRVHSHFYKGSESLGILVKFTIRNHRIKRFWVLQTLPKQPWSVSWGFLTAGVVTNLKYSMFIFRLLALSCVFHKRNPKDFYFEIRSVKPPTNVQNLLRGPLGPSGQVVGSILDTELCCIHILLRKTSGRGVRRSPV